MGVGEEVFAYLCVCVQVSLCLELERRIQAFIRYCFFPFVSKSDLIPGMFFFIYCFFSSLLLFVSFLEFTCSQFTFQP